MGGGGGGVFGSLRDFLGFDFCPHSTIMFAFVFDMSDLFVDVSDLFLFFCFFDVTGRAQYIFVWFWVRQCVGDSD